MVKHTLILQHWTIANCSHPDKVRAAIQAPRGTAEEGAQLRSPHTRATQWTSSADPALKRPQAKLRTQQT